MTNTSGATHFLEIDIRSLPVLGWEILRLTVNDYLIFREDHLYYQEALHWLFLEDFDPELNCKQMDVMSFYVISRMLNIDTDRFRFELQILRDSIGDEKQRDPRGRKDGFLPEEMFQVLVERCQCRLDES